MCTSDNVLYVYPCRDKVLHQGVVNDTCVYTQRGKGSTCVKFLTSFCMSKIVYNKDTGLMTLRYLLNESGML